jgi:NADH dehydrogenase [ubiquinone] 1 alpha subcomplex assembly factor 7
MTQLAEILLRQIRATGPITLAEYMSACLLHPKHGYYTTQDALGVDGDFTTAPEISQMFGELVGLCLAQAWMDQGAPQRFALVELGPGRGTLIADLMRATAQVPGFHIAAELHLVEAADRMRRLQAAALPGHRPTWHDTVETLPEDIPVYVIANEFFDALPIRQFQRDPKGWREVMVGIGQDGKLQRGLSDAAPIDALDNRLQDTKTGALVETCAHGSAVVDAIARRIVRHGGMALIVDYGGWHSDGDTFQAVRRHRPVDPFADPGQADLTAHVDFEALARAALIAGCAVSQFTNQGVFLERLGLTPRAQSLAKTLTGNALAAHVAAHRRLTHPDEMGSLFKVLGLYPVTESPPPGLDP